MSSPQPAPQSAQAESGPAQAGLVAVSPMRREFIRPPSPSSLAADYPHDDLWDALREVLDIEMGISLVDMGMIVGARCEGEHGDQAHIQLTYTAMGCPATEMIEEDIRARLARVPGVASVAIEVVWEPIWTKARLTEEGRDALLLLGIAL